MTQLWTILNAGGEVVQPCCSTPDADTLPADCGEPWEEGFEAVAIEQAPDLHRQFWQGGAWVLIPEIAHDQRWEEAKAFFELRCESGFTLPGIGVIQTRQKDREAILALYNRARDKIAMGVAWKTTFKNEANVRVPVTALEIVAVYNELQDFLGDCYDIKEGHGDALKAALAAGATAEEILAIDITAGFPA